MICLLASGVAHTQQGLQPCNLPNLIIIHRTSVRPQIQLPGNIGRNKVPPPTPPLYPLLSSRTAPQTDSCRLPTVAAQVRARVKSCVICSGQRGTAAGFLRVLRFPLPLIHSTNCSTVIVIICHRDWYNRATNDCGNSGLGSTSVPYLNNKLSLQ
jgi:hypothetical protein